MLQKLVLIVEDDEHIRACLVDIVEAEGYVVYQASHGLDAINVLKKIPTPSLILVDVMMPYMNGPDFVTNFKQDPHHSDVPVIYLSAVQQTELPFANKFLKKPVDIDHLVKALEEHCGEKAQSPLLTSRSIGTSK